MYANRKGGGREGTVAIQLIGPVLAAVPETHPRARMSDSLHVWAVGSVAWHCDEYSHTVYFCTVRMLRTAVAHGRTQVAL